MIRRCACGTATRSNSSALSCGSARQCHSFAGSWSWFASGPRPPPRDRARTRGARGCRSIPCLGPSARAQPDLVLIVATKTDPIRAAGASAKPPCRPSLTRNPARKGKIDRRLIAIRQAKPTNLQTPTVRSGSSYYTYADASVAGKRFWQRSTGAPGPASNSNRTMVAS